MRWERFFDDLEDQLASEWEAERAALDTEAERLRLSRVSLRQRLRGLAGRERSPRAPVFEFTDGQTVTAEVEGVGADWAALVPEAPARTTVMAPLWGIAAVSLSHADILHSARQGESPSPLADRLTFGFALRDLVRRRVGVAVHLSSGRVLTGTVDRAGADHLDLALHDPDTPRRADAVTGFRVIPFGGVARVLVRGDGPRV